MTAIGRVLVVVGAAAVAVAVILNWVTVSGLPVHLDWLGTGIPATGRTVSGLDTPTWPYLLAGAVVVAGLGLAGRARRLLILLGLATTIGGAALVYYLSNVIDIETSHRSRLERLAADLVVRSSVGPGAFVLLAGGACILLGALPRRR